MGILTGIRVADFTRVVSGPFATMLLGDLGADVFKIERPGTGDDTRGWGPPFVGSESTYFFSVNRNKKSVVLDLRTDEGRAQARRLSLSCDVVVENFRPGYMDRVGLGYETLRAERSDIIYCGISGFGQTGPYRDRAGYDVPIQAMGGLMSITGEPERPPVKTGVALVDVIAAQYAFSGILAALYHRERTGEGQRVDVSLLGAELAALINVASAYLVAGEMPIRRGTAHASIVPYQVFGASDGYVMIGAANDKLFAAFCAEAGRPEWASDPRFMTNVDRVQNREALLPLIDELVRTDTVANWVERLQRAGVAVAPVNDVAQAFADPQVAQSGQVVTIAHPVAGDLPLVGPAALYSQTPAEVRLPPPLLGEHTAEVLSSLGYGQSAGANAKE
ncbi:MAG TPA: CoA transferase [Ktedonobacterales bacterium]|nr:CoA transferase [Ktedonobacterales bacterium]